MQLNVDDAKDLRSIFLQNEPHGGLFLKGHENVAAGTRVMVSIKFGVEKFDIPGRVIWRRTREAVHGNQVLQKGAAIAFGPEQEQTVRRLLFLAEDPSISATKRKNPRFPWRVQVRYNSYFAAARDIASDLSLCGMKIQSESPPEPGTRVELVLRLPLSVQPLRLTGVVTWRREHEEPCFGIRFVDLNERAKKKLARLVWKIQAPD